ncbi:MAG TPA: hypothetical protein VK030_03510 [Actinomycetales bacterium]|nr:hypothetical protein [Actinomycetales bacterium]
MSKTAPHLGLARLKWIGATSMIYVVLTGLTMVVKDPAGGAAELLFTALIVASATMSLLLLRAILGWVHLVPGSWRRPHP